MKERPINMTAEEVRALLDGRKTQFRRVVKTQPPANADLCLCAVKGCGGNRKWHLPCPYGQPGDRLWVRETFIHEPAEHDWALSSRPYREASTVYRADVNRADLNRDAVWVKWTPSIHMPRNLSRITLEVVSVRVERLQDISEEDAKAEGVQPTVPLYGDCGGYVHEGHRDAFFQLWQSMHGPDSWDENPWVWVVEFKVVKGGCR